MIIDAAGGAKIRSFKYKDAEVILIVTHKTFGSTYRTSLKKEWEFSIPVAEYDKLPIR